MPLKAGHDQQQIKKAILEIIQLHEHLNLHLNALLRSADHCDQHQKHAKSHRRFTRHIRWHSLDTPTQRPPTQTRGDRFARHSIDTSRPSLVHTKSFMADAKMAMDVAKIFDRLVCSPHRSMVRPNIGTSYNVF